MTLRKKIAKYISDKEIVFRTLKTSYNLIKRKLLIKNRWDIWTDIFSKKKRYRWQIDIKTYSRSLVITKNIN